MIDSHCHIDFPVFDAHRETIIQNCLNLGFSNIVVPGVQASTWSSLLDLCQHFSLLVPALGIHPCFVDTHEPHHLKQLECLLADNPKACVGEIGLDFFIANTDRVEQQALFEAQLALARSYQRPIIVHCRKAYNELHGILKRHQFNEGGILHAFSGSLQQAYQFIDLGFCLGFGGALSYDRATKLRAVFKSIPEAHIVLETDAPDMPPAFARDEINSPLNLPKIASILAELRGQSGESLLTLSAENTRRVLRL